MKFTKKYSEFVLKREFKRTLPHRERVLKYLTLKKLGWTNSEIAHKHHLSRERIRAELKWYKDTFKSI